MIRAVAVVAISTAAYLTPVQTAPAAPLTDSRPADAATRQLGPLEDVVPVAVSTRPRARETAAAPLVVASWYADKLRPEGALYAAMHRYRWGDPVAHVQVCSFDGVTRCVTVPVVDYCQCYVGTVDERGIDLSPAAFAQLAPLWRGLVRVTVEELE